MELVVEMMPDFTNIRFGSRLMLPIDVNDIHRESVEFVFKAVAESQAKKTIVVTHHLPSFALIAPEYQISLITTAFASELKDRIETQGPDYWIYGHSHANIEALIGKTKLLCNQLGYLEFGESLAFNDELLIEIP